MRITFNSLIVTLGKVEHHQSDPSDSQYHNKQNLRQTLPIFTSIISFN